MKKSLFSLFLIGSMALTSVLPLELLAAKPKTQKHVQMSTDNDFKAKKPFGKRFMIDLLGVATSSSLSILLSANTARLWFNKKPFSSGISASFATLFTIDVITGIYRTYQRHMKPEEIESKIPKWLVERLIKPKTHKPLRIAAPFPGTQLQLTDIPQLPGFYHMVSETPVPQKDGYCGIHALYNICIINERILGNRPSDKEFFAAQKAIVQDPSQLTGLRRIFNSSGLSVFDIEKIINRLKLPVTILRHEETNVFSEYTDEINKIFIKVNKLAHEWHNSTGPRVAHFVCCIPGHGFAISVIRKADGSQAMYLYDCNNEYAQDRAHMRQHIEYIYDRFF